MSNQLIKNTYYCTLTFDSNTRTNYYVRLSNSFKAPTISFNQYNNLLEIKYEFCLEGTFNIPKELIMLDLKSEFANVSNVSCVYKRKYGSTFHLFEATVVLDTKNSSFFNSDMFNKNTTLLANLSVNKTVFNSENLNNSFNEFANEIKQINLNNQICFSNYFPINKLTEYYISNKYKDTYSTLSELPNDFFNWSNVNSNIKPIYYFIQNNTFQNKNYAPINELYQMNVNSPKLTTTFDDVQISINYFIDGKSKQLKIKPDQVNTNIQNSKVLSLNIKTLYDYQNKELIQSDSGVNGIYFPVPTKGKINVTLCKNNVAYKDEIDFSFDNDFYSDTNTNLNIQTSSFIDIAGDWQELIYV